MTSIQTIVITSQLIEELSPSLLNIARCKVARREDAEDLVQEAWFSALSSGARFEGRSSLRTWVTGILRRRIADHYRRQRPSAPLDEQEHENPTCSVAEQRDWHMAAQSALGALSELTALEQRAITLCDIQGLERDEAADVMQITRGYLRVVLSRAHNKLTLSLRNQGVELALCA